MSVLQPQAGAIPLPYPSTTSQPYWDGLLRHELLFQRCGSCGGATHTPAMLCAVCCSTDLAWEPSSRRGTIYSWATVWRPPTPEFVVPYVVVIVELDEGWHLLTNLIACDPSDARVGAEVEIVFHDRGDLTLPYARLVNR